MIVAGLASHIFWWGLLTRFKGDYPRLDLWRTRLYSCLKQGSAAALGVIVVCVVGVISGHAALGTYAKGESRCVRFPAKFAVTTPSKNDVFNRGVVGARVSGVRSNFARFERFASGQSSGRTPFVGVGIIRQNADFLYIDELEINTGYLGWGAPDVFQSAADKPAVWCIWRTVHSRFHGFDENPRTFQFGEGALSNVSASLVGTPQINVGSEKEKTEKNQKPIRNFYLFVRLTIVACIGFGGGLVIGQWIWPWPDCHTSRKYRNRGERA